MTPENKYTLAVKKIRMQFPDDPHYNLYFSVIERAILDLMPRTNKSTNKIKEHARLKSTAKKYLSGEIYHAEACGVDSQWIRRIMKEANITA